jgi:hypothetical protein
MMFSLFDPLLIWLDSAPTHYWCVVLVSGLLVVLSALTAMFGPPRLRRWNRPAVFGGLLALALFAFRWPVLFDNAQDSNPDESQMIAGAIVLTSSPVFWQSVDGTTHGPLVQWPLAALGAAGVRLDYTNTRIFSAVLMWVVIVCTWLTLRVIFEDGLARILVVPAAFFVICAHFFDFVQYSSEHVSMAVLAVATWLLVDEAIAPVKIRSWRLGLVGLLLGSLPFAKLQSVPLGVWVGAAGIVLVLIQSVIPWPARWRRVAWLVGGALTFPLAILVMIVGNGIWRDFWDAYIAGNLMYANTYQANWLMAPYALFELAGRADSFPPFLLPMLWLTFAGMWMRGDRWTSAERRFLVFSFGGLFVAIYAVLSPNRPYTHYLQLLIAPLTLAAGAIFGSGFRNVTDAAHRWSRSTWLPGAKFLVLVFLFFGLVFQVRYCLVHPVVQLGRYTLTHGKIHRSPVAVALTKLTTPADTFALWGWEPRYFVETNRRHATREAHSALQIYDSDMRKFYRERYLADLERSQPAYFVDAVGPGNFGFQNRSTYAHESFATLSDYIATHYRFLIDLDGTRIYARLDRAAAAESLIRDAR